MAVNQTIITRPNTAPTRAVPRRWNMNNATRIRLARMGITQSGRFGAAMLMPSTAPRTEIAGVITPSPYRRAAPNSPSPTSRRRAPSRCRRGWSRASKARMPPSPRLSACMMKVRYLNDTTKLSDQKINDSTPRTFAAVAWRPYSGAKHSLSA
jgi:hypothetical protein